MSLVYKSSLATVDADYGDISTEITALGDDRLRLPVDLDAFVLTAFQPEGSLISAGALFFANTLPSGD